MRAREVLVAGHRSLATQERSLWQLELLAPLAQEVLISLLAALVRSQLERVEPAVVPQTMSPSAPAVPCMAALEVP